MTVSGLQSNLKYLLKNKNIKKTDQIVITGHNVNPGYLELGLIVPKMKIKDGAKIESYGIMFEENPFVSRKKP